VQQLLATIMLVTISSVVHAQVNCQSYGNTTNCNGSLGPGISPLAPTDWSSFGRGAANAQAAQQLMQAQAQLAAAQAQAIQQQTEILREQQIAAAAQSQALQRQNEILREQQLAAAKQQWAADLGKTPTDELLTVQSKLHSYNCLSETTEACWAEQPLIPFELESVNAELRRRGQPEESYHEVEFDELAGFGELVREGSLKYLRASAKDISQDLRNAPEGSSAHDMLLRKLKVVNDEIGRRRRFWP
jgi:hypothetical protein